MWAIRSAVSSYSVVAQTGRVLRTCSARTALTGSIGSRSLSLDTLQSETTSAVISPNVVVPSEVRRQPNVRLEQKVWIETDPTTTLQSGKEYLDILDRVKVGTTLDAVVRIGHGKYAAEEIRSMGYIPSSLSGFPKKSKGTDSDMLLAVKPSAIESLLHHRQGSFENTLFELKLADGRRYAAVISEYQCHPLHEKPMTLNFKLYNPDKGSNVHIPLVFLEEEKCPAIRRGGYLNRTNWTLYVKVFGPTIVNSLHFDIGNLEVGSRVRWSDCLNNDNMRLAKLNKTGETDPIVATIKGKSLETEAAADLDSVLGSDFDLEI